MKTLVLTVGLTLYMIGAVGLAFAGAVLGGLTASALGASGAAEPALLLGGAALALCIGAAAKWIGPERFVGRSYLQDDLAIS
jgi:hypothetical protein